MTQTTVDYVDLVASRYDWVCHKCGHMQSTMDATSEVWCEKCDAWFAVRDVICNE